MLSKSTLRYIWSEHIVALLIYFVFTVGLTWPLVPNFTTKVIGWGDMWTHLWTLWHTKQALLGYEPLYHAPLVFYPDGVSLFVHGLGPVMGVFALPFWPWGPAAAYNGAAFVGFWLTGYLMYRFARALNFERGVSLFAGTVLLVSPKHLIPLFGYTDAIFLGSMPLMLLTLTHALNLERSRWWTIAAAFTLLFTLLNSGWQFVIVAISTALVTLATLATANPNERWSVLQRSIVIAVIGLILTAPLLYGHLSEATNPELRTSNNLESYGNQADFIQFFVPATFVSRFFGPFFADFLNQYATWGAEINETTLFMSWLVLLLSFLALLSGNKKARGWFLFVLFFFILSLGPRLKLLGQTEFTQYNLPIILPYAFFTSLPGLGFLRTPGRFMQMGTVGLAITASFGLTWLLHKLSRKSGYVLTLAAIAFILIENWPLPWHHSSIGQVPEFYQQIAQEDEQYGVFDLPIRPYEKPEFPSSYYYFASYYQFHQMTHGKGIASAYISRQFIIHPVFGHFIGNNIFELPYQSKILVNGQPANRYENLPFQLSENDYRYVVFHKAQDWYVEYHPGSWGELESQEFIAEGFAEQEPIVDDELVTVYEVTPFTDTTQLKSTIALRGADNWPRSPATFYVASPRSQIVPLEIKLEGILNTESDSFLDKASITVQSANGFSDSAEIEAGQAIKLPVVLEPGSQRISITAHSDEVELDEAHPSPLMFNIAYIDLQTADRVLSPPDIFVNGQLQQDTSGDGMAFHDDGWYDSEAPTWRWAMSPAKLFVYSPVEQEIALEITPAFLNDANNLGQTSTQGNMLITTNNEQAQQLPVQLEQSATANLNLDAGWNSVILSLESGNFRPSDIEPENGDQRLLSFVLSKINLLTK